jgi:hypothetical protein
MSCDPEDDGITECLERVGEALPDNFFTEGYTDSFIDPLLVVLYADYLCDACLIDTVPGAERMPRAEILARLGKTIGLGGEHEEAGAR